jgi:hypothetical protein
MIEPPHWSSEQLEEERVRAIDRFRRERMEEPLEEYLEAFDEYRGRVEDLLESTVDLSNLDTEGVRLITDPNLLEALRYVTAPPISADDLKVVAEAVLTPSRLRKDPEMAQRIIQVIRAGLDRARFPWVVEGREPTEAERGAAVLASTALIATRKVETARRNVGKEKQEQRVEEALTGIDFKKVSPRKIEALAEAPAQGQFCGECMCGPRKADFVVGLFDHRAMPIECKVSNSSTNSVKRLNNDAAVKAVRWRERFGEAGVVPTAVLSGVYKLHNLEQAQERGLTLFWAHDLGQLTEWIRRTKGS